MLILAVGAVINWELIKAMTEELGVPVIAEGGIWEPQEACQALELGVHAVVVWDSDHSAHTPLGKALCCGNATP